MERFSRDFVILRTGVTPAVGEAGLLFMSCEGRERRWRLSLSRPLLESIPVNTAATAPGDMFLRPAGPPRRPSLSVMGRAQIHEGRVLTLAEPRSSGDGFVPAFIRLLKAGPERFDLLIRTTNLALRHRMFGTAVPAVVFAPVVRSTDIIAFDDFLATCLATSE